MNFYSYNFAALVGYVGCKPFYATAKGRDQGVRFCKISMATRMVDRNGNRRTMWHDVICWGAMADWANRWVVKGSQILVEGYLESYLAVVKGTTDAKYWKTQIRARDIVFMTKPPKPMKDAEIEAPADDSLPADLDDGVPHDPIEGKANEPFSEE